MLYRATNKRGLRAISALVIALLLVLSGVLLLPGCGGATAVTGATVTSSATTTGVATTASQATTTGSPGGGTTVVMKQFAFNPATVTVKVGDTVTWENQDGANHDVTADDGSFKSAEFGKGKTFSFTFSKAGTYTYKCKLHPGMDGTVIVQ